MSFDRREHASSMSFGLPQQPFCEDSLFYPSSLAPLLVLLAILLLPPLLLHISSSSVGILVQGFPWAMLTTLDWPDCSAELAALDLPDCKALRLAEGRTRQDQVDAGGAPRHLRVQAGDTRAAAGQDRASSSG